MTPEEQDKREQELYNGILALMAKLKSTLPEAVNVLNRLYITVALNANNGDQHNAGRDLRDYMLPDLQNDIDDLLENKFPLELVKNEPIYDPDILKSFDTLGKKAN